MIGLDVATGTLVRDGLRVRLRPKTLAVLRVLAERKGAVVSQHDLRRLVWGTRYGNDAGPKQCIRELRRLLDDPPGAPRSIETVGRSGYRLVADVELTGRGDPSPPAAMICVGREAELAVLSARLAAAGRGEPAMVLIAGEPGAGKTRLADAFLAAVPASRSLWTLRGQCVPHAEAREPYGPLIKALDQLASGPLAHFVRPLLRDVAPAWAAQLPGPGDPRAGSRAHPDTGRPTPDRMVRELCDLMERVTEREPGILLLEDIHWADPSTLAWLAAWSLRRTSARLLVVGTYRSDEADALGATLRVLGRQRGFELIRLGGLDEAAVAEFLRQRFPGNALPAILAATLARRTEGHAILVDAMVEQWVGSRIRKEAGSWVLSGTAADLAEEIAPGVRKLIVDRIEALSDADRQLLEAASVAGEVFSAAALAEGRVMRESVERRLERLARGQRFIERAGTASWPDGTVATRYGFRHALHRDAFYDLMPAANRQGMHRRIGLRLEAAFGASAAEIAPALADHFERGGDWPRAARHRGRSAAAALDRGAGHEAALQFRQALALHARCAEDEELRAAELEALQGLGAALIVTEGFIAADLPAVYRRAQALAQHLVDPAKAIPALAGLWNYHVSRADMATAATLAEDLLRRAADAPPTLRMAAHNAAGFTRWFTGAPRESLPHIRAVLALHETGAPGAAALFGEDPSVVCRQYGACVHQILGDAAEAERQFQAGMAAAEALDQPFGRAQMLWAGAVIARERDDPATMLDRARALIRLCERDDIPFWLPAGNLMAGWAAIALDDPAGLAQLRDGLAAYTRMDVRSTQPYSLALFAEAAARSGDVEEGLRALGRALGIARATGERWYEPELHRLWADLSRQAGRTAGVELALRRARALARAQGATHFERRAAARLAALRRDPGKAPRSGAL